MVVVVSKLVPAGAHLPLALTTSTLRVGAHLPRVLAVGRTEDARQSEVGKLDLVRARVRVRVRVRVGVRVRVRVRVREDQG